VAVLDGIILVVTHEGRSARSWRIMAPMLLRS